MRKLATLPLAAGLVLGACGGAETEETADAGMSAEEAMAATDDDSLPMAGQYRTNVEVLEMNVPGMPEGQAEQMRQMLSGSNSEGYTYCLTPEEAAEGPRRMVQEMAESDCVFNSFEFADGNISTDMTCADEDGLQGNWTMEGTYDRDSTDVTVGIEQTAAQGGPMRMRMRMQSERIGECEA
jgi:hypothetical protein